MALPALGLGVTAGSEQACAVWHGLVGREEDDCAVLIRKPDGQHLRHKLADLPGRKIDDCRHLPSDQLLGSVVDCNLGARPLCPERRPEIDRQLVGWLACFRERLCLDDGADADVDGEELVEGDRRGGRIADVVIKMHCGFPDEVATQFGDARTAAMRLMLRLRRADYFPASRATMGARASM